MYVNTVGTFTDIYYCMYYCWAQITDNNTDNTVNYSKYIIFTVHILLRKYCLYSTLQWSITYYVHYFYYVNTVQY